MKEITGEEFDKLFLHGHGSSSPFYNKLMNMKVGDAYIIYKTEWRVKYFPGLICKRVSKNFGHKFKYGSLPDRSGWAIKRVG